MNLIWIDSAESTNTLLRNNPGMASPMTLLCAYAQTAGRGQRGNSWEAEPGKNLTFSFRFHPEGIRPSEQFRISEATALAVTDALDESGISAKVKWPNDIYVDERKIAGILIEHMISGQSITQTIVGVGLNVNQTSFISDAPNPVSMAMITGREYDLDQIALSFRKAFLTRMTMDADMLHAAYMNHLWRGDGLSYPYRDTASGVCFKAKTVAVEPEGFLILEDDTATLRRYAFKEVEAIRSNEI